MAVPRMIIASSDTDYLKPILSGFTEGFYNKANLEIITDRDYFNELFSSPQRAELLIVSDEMYDVSINRHNLESILLLTGSEENAGSEEGTVHKIYRYSSVKDIFNEAARICASYLKKDKTKKRETQIIAFTSADGGTGKTTAAMGIAGALSREGKKTLYVNSGQLQSFGYLFKDTLPILDNDIYMKLSNREELSYMDMKDVIRCECFSYIPPFKAMLISLGLETEALIRVALEAKISGDYDFVILDTDGVHNDSDISALDTADKAAVIIRQTKASAYAASVLAANINGIRDGKFIFICNDTDKSQDGSRIVSEYKTDFYISGYIDHIDEYEMLKGEDYSNNCSIRKAALLFC